MNGKALVSQRRMMDEVFRIYEEGVIAANGPNSYGATVMEAFASTRSFSGRHPSAPAGRTRRASPVHTFWRFGSSA